MIDAGNFTGTLTITGYIIYYDAFNYATSKLLDRINDPNLPFKSQVYINSVILDVFKD